MNKRTFYLFLFLVILRHEGFCWGARGHKMVAEFAKQTLDKTIVDSVQCFLGNMSFQEAAVWMDEVRSDPAYNYLKPRHYINVERDATYVKDNNENVVNELELVIALLQSKAPRDKEKIAFALRELFHLVGDLHQPLHAGYGEDKGGNTIEVSYAGKPTNLHKIWDTDIIEEENINLKDCFKCANEMSMEEKRAAQKIDVVKWMDESRALLPFVYGFENGKISSEYSSKAKPIIEKQLVKGGIRLAAVLFRAFKK